MPNTKNSQSGFALILALLALLLLTSLGLSLSTGTSTELQISMNHRWTESARYNAEAGLEYGKQVLALLPGDWAAILPPVRVAWLPTNTPGSSAFPVAPGTRNYENWGCDQRGGGVGYGLVLTDASANSPYQYVTTTTTGGSTFTLNGAYTLWVRRPLVWSGGNMVDYGGNDVLILVSEGVAPYAGAMNTQAFAAMNRATYTTEVVLSRTGSGPPCQGRSGQAGGSAQNTNSWGCVNTTGVGDAIGSGVGAGTGNVK